jgi:hypothetical protein
LNPPRYKLAVLYDDDMQFEQDTYFLEGLFNDYIFELSEDEKLLEELKATLTKCPNCQSYMEVYPGEIDTYIKMLDGKELSKLA